MIVPNVMKFRNDYTDTILIIRIEFDLNGQNENAYSKIAMIYLVPFIFTSLELKSLPF